ncbi:hypothetical protein MTO96_046385 [Rhipicephalus appendiculatus]
MLKHYEKECTFHVTECLRCGEGILHRDLPVHCASGCSIGDVAARTQSTSSEPAAAILQDIKAALEELKGMLQNANNDQVLPTIRREMNALTEQVRIQGARLAEMACEVEASVKADILQVAAAVSSTMSERPRSRSRRNSV